MFREESYSRRGRQVVKGAGFRSQSLSGFEGSNPFPCTGGMRMKKFVFFIFALCIVSAYTLYGDIYSANTFENLENVIVEISGASSAKLVASNNYSISLPAGDYIVEAYYIEGGKTVLYSRDEVELTNDIKYDLILFYQSEFETVPDVGIKDVFFEVPIKQNTAICYVALIIAGILVFILGHLLERSRKDEERATEIDKDGESVLKILKENEGRMEQKELREILKWTESKTSLVIAELEAIGYVKKIKRGRKNIIKILGGAG